MGIGVQERRDRAKVGQTEQRKTKKLTNVNQKRQKVTINNKIDQHN